MIKSAWDSKTAAAALLLCAALSSCVAGSTGLAHPAGCRLDGVEIDVAFPGAGRHSCAVVGVEGVRLKVRPEPASSAEINPSPWFAFRITSDSAREFQVTLDYDDQKHRYNPWVKVGAEDWAPLDADRVSISADRTTASLVVELAAGVTLVSAQPVAPSEDGVEFVRAMLAGHDFTEVKYGRSVEGRLLTGFVWGASDAVGVIVAMTRQHPPETTGQDAFQAFVERLARHEDVSASAFRSHYKIILAPMPNPDGVDGGHWRLNSGGVDLNRDWLKFSQPETASLAAWIIQEVGRKPVISFIDFHSTNRTVVYAPPLDAPSSTIGLLDHMRTRFDTTLTSAPTWSYSHNPEGGTSKAWALEVLGAPGLTLELSDQISRRAAREIGLTAAEAVLSYRPF